MGGLFFGGALPGFFLLLNLATATLQPDPFLAFLPFIIFVSALLTFRFHIIGLSFSYLTLGGILVWLIQHIEPTHSTWTMGIFFSIALSLYILLLGREEIELCFKDLQDRSQEQAFALQQIGKELIHMKQSAQSKEEELEEEIKKWKEEAEQRRIERTEALNRLESTQSEVALLNLQKEEFIQEMNRVHALHLAAEKKLEEAYAISGLQMDKVKQTEAELCAFKQAMAEHLIHIQEEVLILQQKPAVIVERMIEIQAAQAGIVPSVDFERISELERSLKISESKYTQLRLQFEEKGETLSQARRELYELQGQLKIFEEEKASAMLNPDRTEATLLEEQVNLITQEMGQLDEEITLLENLLSSFFS